jgi:hypothetical protein
MRDSEIHWLNDTIMKMKNEEDLISYKPIVSDPLDVKLGNYINRAPIGLRSKMNF